MAEITERMDKTIDSLSHEFAKVRTGRATLTSFRTSPSTTTACRRPSRRSPP